MNPRRILVVVFVGTFLAQAAWILSVPPFRGSDEFDHAYRAAAVAHGEWMPEPKPAANGRGDLVTVPRSIVTAAGPQCSALGYTGPDNCNPVSDEGDGMVTVASAAARYHPAFYWAVGTPAKLFDGANALYAMRIVGAIICAGMVTFAARNVLIWSRTRWPLAAVLASLTPVLVYSTAVAAPNGIEMASALALWGALLGLGRLSVSPSVERALLWSTIPSGMVLATVRTLGPLWLALVVLTVVGILGGRQTLAIVRRHAGPVLVITTVLVSTTLASTWWIIASSLNSLEVQGAYPDPFSNTIRQIPLWLFQTIAAFPVRNEQAPAVVYAAGFVVLGGLLAAAFIVGSSRARAWIALTSGIAILVPFVLTFATYESEGPIWQGRYGLPYSVGVILLAGLILDTARPRHRLIGPLLLTGWLALLVGHVVGMTNVVIRELAGSVSAGTSSWYEPQPWMVVLLMTSGLVLWGFAVGMMKEGKSPRVSAAGVPVLRDELDGKLLEEQTHVRDDAPRL